MEIIKRKILLDKLNEDNFNFKIALVQSIDNLGMMSDMVDGGVIKSYSGNLPYHFMVSGVTSTYYKQAGIVNYTSDSKLEVVRSYNNDEPYIENFDIKKSVYNNYLSENITGVDRVIKINGDEIIYTVNAKRDINIGTSGQTSGILYIDNPEGSVNIPEELDGDTSITKVQYFGEGWNETNTSILPQVQEEYLIGIISEPEVKSDVFIDRSTFSVLDKHLRLSEINSLSHLTKYGNGFFKINRN